MTMRARDALARAEDRAVHPLFPLRRPSQCVWPLWDSAAPFETKRCCGAAVRAPGRPYCEPHEAVSAGPGTISERGAIHEAKFRAMLEARPA